MKIFDGNVKDILYIGEWEECDTSKLSKNDFCKLAFMFRGESVKINTVGEILWSVDGGTVNSENEIMVDEGVHTAFVTVMEGVVVKSVETEELLNVDVYLRGKLNNEIVEILQGRCENVSEDWKKVEYSAMMPKENVKLEGLFSEIFEKCVERIKRCSKAPYYLERNINNDESGEGWVGWLPAANESGRILGSASKAYRWIKDEELKEVIETILEKISDKTRDDGYYNYYPEEDSYAANYFPNIENSEKVIMDSERKNFDRTYWTYGMVAAGEAGFEESFRLARGMYDWLEKSEWKRQLILGHNGTNAYMGSLVLADSKAGKAEDILLNRNCLDLKTVEEEFAKQNPLIFSNYPGDRPHCYVVLDLLAMIYEYRLTGEKHYLDATLGGWEVYRKYYKHLGGLTAICELDGPYFPGTYYMKKGHTGESCGTIFWIWLNRELNQLFPDEEKFAAEIEEGLLNVVPSLNVWGEGVRYHNRLTGRKNVGASTNVASVGTCCELTTALLCAELPGYGFVYDENTVWINQFMSYSAHTEFMDFDVEADTIVKNCLCVGIKRAAEKELTVKIRVPLWAQNADVYVNDELVEKDKNGTYAVVNRVWKSGDVIMLKFTPEIKAVRYTGVEQPEDGKKRYGLMYGPYLMALVGDFGEEIPGVTVDISSLKAEKTETSFEIKVNKGMKFIPYYEFDDSVRFECFPIFE